MASQHSTLPHHSIDQQIVYVTDNHRDANALRCVVDYPVIVRPTNPLPRSPSSLSAVQMLEESERSERSDVPDVL